jgi:hypothetical protein
MSLEVARGGLHHHGQVGGDARSRNEAPQSFDHVARVLAEVLVPENEAPVTQAPHQVEIALIGAVPSPLLGRVVEKYVVVDEVGQTAQRG